jgi:hypothetical protein
MTDAGVRRMTTKLRQVIMVICLHRGIPLDFSLVICACGNDFVIAVISVFPFINR